MMLNPRWLRRWWLCWWLRGQMSKTMRWLMGRAPPGGGHLLNAAHYTQPCPVPNSTLPSTAGWGRTKLKTAQYITVEIWMARTINRWWMVGYWSYVWCHILRGVCPTFFIFQCARHGAELEVCTLLSEVCKEEVLVLEVVPPHPHFLPHSVGTPG